MRIHLERRYRFSASHLYWRTEWTEEENRRAFGRCATRPGHGHNYRMHLTVRGEVDETTGFIVDLAELDRRVHEHVLEALDHRHVNEAVEAFQAGGKIPSSENLVTWIAERLEGQLPEGVSLRRVRLAEDEDLAAVWERE